MSEIVTVHLEGGPEDGRKVTLNGRPPKLVFPTRGAPPFGQVEYRRSEVSDLVYVFVPRRKPR